MLNKEMLKELRENGIVAVNSKSKFNNQMQYRGLTYNKNINKEIEPIKLQYKNKIGFDLKDEIINILSIRNKVILVVANAGGGKTYVMMQCASELAKKNPNTAYVLIVPNTSQSDQNQLSEDLREFGFTSIVGKKNGKRVSIDTNKQLFSCVYDKALETIEILKKAGKEVVLIVDEAHKLIWDTYRDCLIEVDEAITGNQFKADMVLMMTATPRACLKYYKYDQIYELEDMEVKNNILKLRPVYTKSWIITLLREINKALDKGLKPLIRLNSKEEIRNIIKILSDSGIKAEMLTSDNKKDNEIFRSIELNGTVGDTAQVLLCTSVIECGISLKATDIVPIEVIRKARDFNKDNTIQFFARPRKQVKEGIMIIKQYDDDLNIDKKSVLELKDYDWYFNEIAQTVNHLYLYVKSQLDMNLKTKGFEYSKKQLEIEIAILKNNRNVINCIEADFENLNVYIDYKKVIQRVLNEMDKDIVIKSPLQIKKTFKDTIFYENIELEVDEVYVDIKDLIDNGIKPRIDKNNMEDMLILDILKDRKIKKHLKDIVFDIYDEELDICKVSELKKHRLYPFIKDAVMSFNITEYIKELRRENTVNKKLKIEDYRQLLNDDNFIKAIPAIRDKEITADNIAEYNLEISLHDIIDFRETKLFKVLVHAIDIFGLEEAIKLINHHTINKDGEKVYISNAQIYDLCEIKYFIEKSKNYVGVTKYDLIYKIILQKKKGKQVNLSKNLIIELIGELVKDGHYKNRKLEKLIKEIKKEAELYDVTETKYEFYSKENIKKLEQAISSQLINKVMADINKIFRVGQDSKGYDIINSSIKVFNLNDYLI